MKTIAILLALVILSACGGNSDNPPAPKFVRSIGPQLRPCETTGPTAPACPASSP